MQTSEEKIRIWQLRAEEYRAAADNVTNQTVKETYLRLARNYERLAEHEARNQKLLKDKEQG